METNWKLIVGKNSWLKEIKNYLCRSKSFITSRDFARNFETSCIYMYIHKNLFAVDISRQIVPSFLLLRNTIHSKRTVSADRLHHPLFATPSSFELSSRKLLASSLKRLHEISRNPNAQFSASIFSGIQSTYVSSCSCALCKGYASVCTCSCRCNVSVYVRERVRVQSSEWNVEERRKERTRMSEEKLWTQWGWWPCARQSRTPSVLSSYGNFSTYSPNNLGALFVSASYNHKISPAENTLFFFRLMHYLNNDVKI